MTQEPDVWRRIQSETRVQLQGPYQDQEFILSLLLPTLHVLELAPQDDLLVRDVERCRPSQLWDIDEAKQQDERFQQAFQNRAWLQDLQAALLGPIANDWSEELDRRGKWQPLLQAFFCPTRSVKQPSSRLIVLAEPDETDTGEQNNIARLWASGLQVFASALSRLSSQPGSPTPSLREALLKVASFYMQSGTTLLSQLLVAYEVEKNPAKRQLAWQEAVVVLNSLPIKLANAFKGDVPEQLSATNYFANLSSQIVASLSSPETSSKRIAALAALLSKLLRAGNIATTRLSETDFAKGFWPIAISKAAGCSSDSGLKKRFTESWRNLYSCMEARDRLALVETFVVCLDRITARQGLGNLVHPSEHGKAAQCGKAFLSQEATRLCELQTQLLEVFVGTQQSSSSDRDKRSSSPEDSDDDDAQVEADSPFSLFTSILLRHDAHFSPLTTRSLCRYVSNFGLDKAQEVLLDVVDHWGGSTRVRRASNDQEQYLTVLLVGLLAEVANLTGNGSRIGQTISRRPSFIEGVGAHLEHLDPQIRRLGMLLAEVVSERAHAESESTGGGQMEGPKAIDFGRSMWDGIGEGKEESRILRAMFHSWSSLTSTTSTISSQGALEILGLLKSAVTEAEPELLVVAQPTKRQPPPSTSLPRQVSAKASKQARPLISLVDDLETDAAPPTQARITAIESDDEGSSSESDSSDDDAGPSSDHKGFAEPDMPLGGLNTSSFKPSAKSSTSKENAEPVPGEQYEVNDRKRRRPPIYIHEIASMLRERDRDPIRIALKHGEALIRKKAGWGGEVDENSIDLAFLLVGLQNNFKIKSFEERRTGILTALVVASPRLTTGTIIEQFFTDDYSLAQRFSILNALASGARELAGLAPMSGSSKTRPQVEGLAEDLSNTAISRAKAEGTERVPEVKREQAFKLTSKPGAGRTSGAIQELNGSSSSSVARGVTSGNFGMLPGAISRPKERYVDLSSSVFLFPLINRFSAHIREASARYSRTTAYSSRHSSTSTPGGYGTSTLFDPMLLSALLDTLSVLVHASRNSLDFLAVTAPEMLNLSLLVVGSALPLSIIGSSESPHTSKEKQQEEASHRISGSILSLNLVILDTSYLLDSGKTLLRDHSRLVDDVASWAAEIFQALEHVVSTPAPSTNGGGVAAFKEVMGSSRAARASAAVLLRIEEMRSQWREERLGPRR